MTLRPTFRAAATLALGAITALGEPPCAAAADAVTRPTPVEPAAPTPPLDLAAFGAVGFSVAENLHLHELQWTSEQFEMFVTGLRASYRGDKYPVDERTIAGFDAIRGRIHAAQTSNAASTAPPKTDDGSLDEFLQKTRRELGLQAADSGLYFRIAKGGSGPRPRKTDVVTITLEATSPDTPNGLPQLAGSNVRIKVSELLPGLAEGVQMLAIDGAAFLLLPPALSFGNGAWPTGIKSGTPLLFNIRLHDIEEAEATP